MAFWRRYARTRALALAPFVLFVVSLPSQMLMRCRLDGQLRTACCCPASRTGEESKARGPVLSDPRCCHGEGSRHASRAIAVRPATDSNVPAGAVVIRSYVARAEHEGATWIPGSQRSRPPREGPRIIVLKQSFLI
jgi:hypothetical protein